jgi:hypothetical protein
MWKNEKRQETENRQRAAGEALERKIRIAWNIQA